jgi:preprotein translocase subunit YajC
MNNLWILAQKSTEEAPSHITSEQPATEQGKATTTTADSNAPPTTQQRQTVTNPLNFVLLAVMFVVMYLLVFRGPRQKQQQHKQMVQSLEKNDKVRTIGGIIGTVVDVKGDEVTLKVDESTNTKIKVAASAIGKNLSKDKDKDKS